MKKVIITGIIIFIVGLVGASFMVYNRMGLEEETPFKHEKMQNGSAIHNVKVVSNSVDMEIYPSTNNQIKASFKGTKQENVTTDLQLTTNGDTVEIQAIRNETSYRNWIHFDIGAIKQPTKVAVYLPKKQYNSLMLQTNNADIQLSDYSGKTATANTKSGDIKLQNTDASLSVQTGHGDIHLTGAINLKANNTITTSSGDIHMEFSNIQDPTKPLGESQLSLKSTQGDISLSGYQGKKLEANTTNGDVTLQNINTNFSVSSSNGDIHMQSINNFHGQNQVNTSNGDINVAVGHDPKTLNVNFEGSNVQSDFPIQGNATSTNNEDNRELKGTIGTDSPNPPTLMMKTSFGDVSFSR
ncbi:DUF4097 family beta strand repeat-containing protein [Shimazuella alba]|uniref:DUF4097 family beta strand repeat protein n=1 Tax=Shimazuella alba TaxID=2690964 RepID=A0A6I4VSK3_9BACL|nr:DUF4097 family beta strand repeat-containing protein [Shimazuella alba]MXQ52896.1 DUF4097 family beta strand repeat protein [Shimazuella alba]